MKLICLIYEFSQFLGKIMFKMSHEYFHILSTFSDFTHRKQTITEIKLLLNYVLITKEHNYAVSKFR